VAATSALAMSVRGAIRDAVAGFTVPGAQVAWLCDGSIEHVEHGLLAIGRPTAVTPATRFRLGSVTKALTASLAIQLVGDGALDLDGPIGDLLPGGRCRELLGDVSLRQLLSHSSGLEDRQPGGGEGASSTGEYVRTAITRDLLFPPGALFSYSNVGFIVVGHLIEAATGVPWAEALQDFLLGPLGVTGTFFLSQSVGPRALAERHVNRGEGEFVRLTGPDSLPRCWAPAGGLALNAGDLVRVMHLHLSGGRDEQGAELLEPSLVAEMRTRQAEVPDRTFGEAWGLGWTLYGQGRFGHDGGDEGAMAFVQASPDHDFAVALLVSCVPADAEWRRLCAALTSAGVTVGEEAPPALPACPLPMDPALAGAYENGVLRLQIVPGGDEAWLEVGTQLRRPLRGAGPDRCVMLPDRAGEAPDQVLFVRDQRGTVQHLYFQGRLFRRRREP
jgi:CubicO group peptidase (beta-lactamase class C family)